MGFKLLRDRERFNLGSMDWSSWWGWRWLKLGHLGKLEYQEISRKGGAYNWNKMVFGFCWLWGPRYGKGVGGWAGEVDKVIGGAVVTLLKSQCLRRNIYVPIEIIKFSFIHSFIQLYMCQSWGRIEPCLEQGSWNPTREPLLSPVAPSWA